MSGPAWSPSLSDVGDRVPTRTVDATNPGSDTLLGTFTDKTQPTDVQVQRLIDGAVSGVLAVVPTITDAISSLAKDAAAWRAAADVELVYPERNADVSVYNELNSRAQLELERLIQAAETSGGGAVATSPVWSFPPPPSWGNDYL